MRRAWIAVVSLSVVSLTACGGSGTLPSSLPSSVPSALPSLTRTDAPSPSRTVEPTRTAEPTQTESAPTNSPQPTVTETQTATETQAATEAPTPSDSASASPKSSNKDKAANAESDQGVSPWVWVLLGLLVVGGLVTWWVVGSRRRKAVAAWESDLDTQTETARWVDSRFVTDLVSQPTAAQQEQVWTTGRPRLVEADAALDALAVNAPDPEHRAQATALRDALAGLRSAIDSDVAVAAPGGDPEAMRASRAGVEQARSKLHDLLTPPAPQGG